MQENGFSLTCTIRIKVESYILSIYGRIQLSEKMNSRMFYVVEAFRQNCQRLIAVN